MVKVNAKIMEMFSYYAENGRFSWDAPIIFQGVKATMDGIHDSAPKNKAAYAFIKHIATTLSSQDSYANKTSMADIVNAYEGAEWCGEIAPEVTEERRSQSAENTQHQQEISQKNHQYTGPERRAQINTPRAYKSLGSLPKLQIIWADLTALAEAGMISLDENMTLHTPLKHLPKTLQYTLDDLYDLANSTSDRRGAHAARYALAKIAQNLHFDAPNTPVKLNTLASRLNWKDAKALQRDANNEENTRKQLISLAKSATRAPMDILNIITSPRVFLTRWPHIFGPIGVATIALAALHTPSHTLSADDVIALTAQNDVSFANYTLDGDTAPIATHFKDVTINDIKACNPHEMKDYPAAYRTFLANMANKFGEESEFYALFQNFVEEGVKEYQAGLTKEYPNHYAFYAMVHRETNAFRDVHNSKSGATGARQHLLERFYEEAFAAQDNIFIAEIRTSIENGTASDNDRSLVNAYTVEMANYKGNAEYAYRMQRNDSGKIDVRLTPETKRFQDMRSNSAFIGAISARRFILEGITLTPAEMPKMTETELWKSHQKAYDPQLGGQVGSNIMHSMLKTNPTATMNNYTATMKVVNTLPSTKNYGPKTKTRLSRHWGVSMTEHHPFLDKTKSFKWNYASLYKGDEHRIAEALKISDGKDAPILDVCTGNIEIAQYAGKIVYGLNNAQKAWKATQPIRSGFMAAISHSRGGDKDAKQVIIESDSETPARTEIALTNG